MDIQSQSTKPISDDQELAQVLAGVTGNMSFEPLPAPQPVVEFTEQVEPTETFAETSTQEDNKPFVSETHSDLESIKNDALLMLRPLLDKVSTTPEEKFDIYLLLLRSTDDKSLIDPAYKCAQNISDESRRAQALLDIVREIDFLSAPAKTE